MLTKTKLNYGDPIKVKSVQAPYSEKDYYPINIVNGFGLSKDESPYTHDNHNLGYTMWRTLPNPEKVEISFDLGTIYPLHEMHIWNYNQYDKNNTESEYVKYGLKNIKIYHSIDGNNWVELKGEGYPYTLALADGSNKCLPTNLVDGNNPISFENTRARYIKLTANPVPGDGNWGGLDGNEGVFGISAAMFTVGKGLYAERTDNWTNLFRRYSGWTGSDGSYSIPFSGYEAPGNAGQTKTIFTFGDTFIGNVDKDTLKRFGPWAFANNTMAILDGANPDPDKIKFIWGKNGTYDLGAVFQPEDNDGSYYWLQDGIVIDGTLSLFVLVVEPDPNGPEGFQFAINNVAMMVMPIGHNGPMINEHKQLKTPLFYRSEDGTEETFMCGAIMPNTVESGAPNPDGYIYVYGHKHINLATHLVASRVKPEDYHSFDKWEFWDGQGWSSSIKDCAVLAPRISCEHSVTPISQGIYKDKYLLIYQQDGTGREVVSRVGDSPVGPFGEANIMYVTPDPEEGQTIYTYNAKAHPHLSNPGELLVSYNCNARNGTALFENGDIYHTRWVCLKDTTIKED